MNLNKNYEVICGGDNKSVSRFESSSDRSSDVFNLNELLRSEELRRKFNTL